MGFAVNDQRVGLVALNTNSFVLCSQYIGCYRTETQITDAMPSALVIVPCHTFPISIDLMKSQHILDKE